MLTSQPDIYGLIGYPLGHSFSERYFNQKFESEKINARYINFEIPDIGDLMEVLAEYPNLRGFNVTIPYKKLVRAYLDGIDEAADEIGAVNVVKVTYGKNEQPVLEGYNSDAPAFADTVRPLLTPARTKALVLGTGGASQAIAYALRSVGVEPQMVSRTAKDGAITYSDLTPEVMASHKVIVNCTPLGMYPHVDECPQIPYELLTAEHLCYDLIYNPDTTLFMRRSAEYGAETKNGLEMLLLQAFISWKIWTGKMG